MAQDPNNYWEQLERLEKLIKNSELKAGIIFSFHSLILGLFVDRLEYIRTIFQGNVVLVIVLILWIICVMVSIYYCFKCFKPQMELKYDKNVFFFRDAVYSFGNAEEYTKALVEICGSEDQMYKQLAEQIHVESKIIDQKFICVRKSIKYFGLSIVFVVLFILFSIIKSLF
jgi:hypothetical protein